MKRMNDWIKDRWFDFVTCVILLVSVAVSAFKGEDEE